MLAASSSRKASFTLAKNKWGVGGNTGVERGSNVLRRAVHTLHILTRANHFGDWLRQRMFKLLRDSGDLRANLRANVAVDEIVDLIEPSHAPRGWSASLTAGLMRSCWASLMMVRLAPPTCLLAPPWVRSPETTWI